jgi:hypothetical protein
MPPIHLAIICLIMRPQVRLGIEAQNHSRSRKEKPSSYIVTHTQFIPAKISKNSVIDKNLHIINDFLWLLKTIQCIRLLATLSNRSVWQKFLPSRNNYFFGTNLNDLIFTYLVREVFPKHSETIAFSQINVIHQDEVRANQHSSHSLIELF